MASNTPSQTTERKGMHPVLKFILMFIAGGAIATVVTPFVLGMFGAATKGWSLEREYSVVLKVFIGAAVGLFVLAMVVGPMSKKWGISGFLLGVSMVMLAGFLIGNFMLLFDEPNFKRQKAIKEQQEKDANTEPIIKPETQASEPKAPAVEKK